MTPEEFNRNFEEVIKRINQQMPKFLEQRAAVDLVSFISRRVRVNAQDATGGDFGTYSTDPILTSGTTAKSQSVWEKLANTKKKRSKLNWVTVKSGEKNVRLFEVEGGYAEIRNIEGFSNKNKNFEFTNEMWNNFGIKGTVGDQYRTTVTIGGKTPESQRKIDANSEREGKPIIEPSKKEINHVVNIIEKFIDQELNKL